jgi:TusA-related sulfurtransferase
MRSPRPDRVLDVVGLYCPVPIIRTADEVRRMESGQVLEVVADDPVTLVDLPNWCGGTGHEYLGWTRGEGKELRLFLRVEVGRHPGRVARMTAPGDPGKPGGEHGP